MEWYLFNPETHEITKTLDLMEWAKFVEEGQRKIAYDELGDFRVSTVFLGLDHSFGHGPPVLFETMVFGKNDYKDEICERYCTYDEAIEGHKEILAGVVERFKIAQLIAKKGP